MRTAIIITIGGAQLKEQGYKKVLKEFKWVNWFNKNIAQSAWYCYRMQNPPKKEFQKNIIKAFIVIGGRVRWSADVVDFTENYEAHFHDGRSMTSKFVRLVNFEKVRIKINLKGFQGFRYVLPGSELAIHYNL